MLNKINNLKNSPNGCCLVTSDFCIEVGPHAGTQKFWDLNQSDSYVRELDHPGGTGNSYRVFLVTKYL